MFEDPDKKKAFTPYAVVQWIAVMAAKLRPVSVFINAKSEFNLADTLAHETAILVAARKLVPQTEGLANQHAELKRKLALVSAAPDFSKASEEAKLAYGAWTRDMVAALNHPDNPMLAGRAAGGIAANILTTLAGPVGRDFVDYLVHATVRPTLEEPGSKHFVLPILSVPFLQKTVFASPFGAASRQPLLQLIEMLEYLGFAKKVRGYDAYVEAYLAETEKRNPVSLFAAGFTPKQLDDQNRQPVELNGKSQTRRVNATTELLVLTADFYIFVAERDELSAKWNAGKMNDFSGIMKRFLLRLASLRKFLGRPGGLAGIALAVLFAGNGSAQPSNWYLAVPHATQYASNIGPASTVSDFVDTDVLQAAFFGTKLREYARNTDKGGLQIYTDALRNGAQQNGQLSIAGQPVTYFKPAEGDVINANAARKFSGSGGDILALYEAPQKAHRPILDQIQMDMAGNTLDMDEGIDLWKDVTAGGEVDQYASPAKIVAGDLSYSFKIAWNVSMSPVSETNTWLPANIWENAGSKKVGSDRDILK